VDCFVREDRDEGFTSKHRCPVSAPGTAAVRRELDRRRLHAFVAEIEEELGPVDEAEVARYAEMFAASAMPAREHANVKVQSLTYD
jgi:hypothetical protein